MQELSPGPTIQIPLNLLLSSLLLPRSVPPLTQLLHRRRFADTLSSVALGSPSRYGPLREHESCPTL